MTGLLKPVCPPARFTKEARPGQDTEVQVAGALVERLSSLNNDLRTLEVGPSGGGITHIGPVQPPATR